MRYRINADIVIKTENAAKPASQSSTYLKALISELSPVACSFDYGCGKLRYRDAILSTTDTLAMIDSEIQLARKQVIFGKLTTIRETARRSNRTTTYNTREFNRLAISFDRAFCINVLSVIPFLAARQRVLRLIRQKLRAGGTCLFVVQYRNSDFTRMKRMANARPWQDGFLIDSLRGYSFYGQISPEQLSALISSAGFEIMEHRVNEGSAYLLARSPMHLAAPNGFDIDEDKNFQLRQ